MKPFWTVFLLALFVVPVALGQAQDLQMPRSLEPAVDESYPIHVTDLLMNGPEGVAARTAFQEMKAQGWQPPVNKSTAAVGDTVAFQVVNIAENRFDTIDFKLMAEEERFFVWVELAELDNGNVSDITVAAIVNIMAYQTPGNSINRSAGVIVNNEQIFGSPPNVDGDGKTDILLVDVRDGYSGSGGYVLGFVSPNDLPGRGGNNRDVLYLDTEPSLRLGGIEGLGETAAHEYQHLIHFNYDLGELTLINEGLSEWAELANGYDGRSIQYLSDPNQYNVSLLDWSGNGNPLVFRDYQRGGVFTSYIAERIGVFDTGAITREQASGAQGYRNALATANADFSFDELLVDFHIANYLNDTSLDPRYGYLVDQRINLRAVPTALFDARVETETSATTLAIEPGGVQYYVWEQVTDLSVMLEGGGGSPSLRTTALLFQNGSFETRTVALGQETFSGDYDRVVFVMVNTNTSVTDAVVTVSATWDVDETFAVENVIYDSGQVSNYVGGGGAEILTRFENPSPGFAFLSKVSLPIYFFSQFSNGPPSSAARDFIFTIREVQADGLPGNVLFSVTQEDTRAYAPVTSFDLRFLEVDLGEYMDELVNLPESFFIGFVDPEGQNDGNQVVYPASSYSLENRTYLLGSTGARALWDVSLTDGTSLAQTVVPIRAQFLVSSRPVSNEDVAELPEQIALLPNYPNPFNPTTTIAFTLPQTVPVRLAVYDVLGREVAVLVDGLTPSGSHQVQIDARAWASGTYFYTLEADGQQQTQRMTLIK